MVISRNKPSGLLAAVCLGLLTTGSGLGQNRAARGKHNQHRAANPDQPPAATNLTENMGLHKVDPISGAGAGDMAAKRTRATAATGVFHLTMRKRLDPHIMVFGMKGWIELDIDSLGNWTYSGHIHEAYFNSGEVALIAIKAGNGEVFGWFHAGGERFTRSPDANWKVTGNSNTIKDHWSAWFDKSKSVWGWNVFFESIAPLPDMSKMKTDTMRAFGGEIRGFVSMSE